MHYRVIENQLSKPKGGFTSFIMLRILEAKIFLYMVFWKNIRCAITVIDPEFREMKSQLWQLNQNF